MPAAEARGTSGTDRTSDADGAATPPIAPTQRSTAQDRVAPRESASHRIRALPRRHSRSTPVKNHNLRCQPSRLCELRQGRACRTAAVVAAPLLRRDSAPTTPTPVAGPTPRTDQRQQDRATPGPDHERSAPPVLRLEPARGVSQGRTAGRRSRGSRLGRVERGQETAEARQNASAAEPCPATSARRTANGRRPRGASAHCRWHASTPRRLSPRPAHPTAAGSDRARRRLTTRHAPAARSEWQL